MRDSGVGDTRGSNGEERGDIDDPEDMVSSERAAVIRRGSSITCEVEISAVCISGSDLAESGCKLKSAREVTSGGRLERDAALREIIVPWPTTDLSSSEMGLREDTSSPKRFAVENRKGVLLVDAGGSGVRARDSSGALDTVSVTQKWQRPLKETEGSLALRTFVGTKVRAIDTSDIPVTITKQICGASLHRRCEAGAHGATAAFTSAYRRVALTNSPIT